VSFLDGLLSQTIEGTGPGTAARSLLLSPQGKLRAPLWLGRTDREVALFADSGVGGDVIADLSRFKIRVDATISAEPVPVGALVGPGARRALDDIGAATFSVTADDMVFPAPMGRSGHPRFLVGDAVAAALGAAGIAPAGSAAATAVRIETGEAVFGVDIDERTIPQEVGPVDSAVSFTKGCYLGQELVARIDSRGHVNRNLRGLVITTNVLPPVGAEAIAGGKPVGILTSVAESLDLRAPVALALIRREVAPGDEVTIRWEGGETTATVRELPLIP
jgi:folate-binding protein YgfZ